MTSSTFEKIGYEYSFRVSHGVGLLKHQARLIPYRKGVCGINLTALGETGRTFARTKGTLRKRGGAQQRDRNCNLDCALTNPTG